MFTLYESGMIKPTNVPGSSSDLFNMQMYIYSNILEILQF